MKKQALPGLIQEYVDKYQLQQYMDTPLAAIAQLHTFRRDDFLIRAGEVSEYLYFLVSGKVICFTCPTNEKYECVAYHQSVALLGEAASLWNRPPVTNVKALSDCICLAVSLRSHRKTLLNDLRFLQHVCYTLACRIDTANQFRSQIEPLDMRLARFILRYSTDGIFTFQLNDCAEILNASYRHLLRMLKRFSAEGILLRARNGYRICDRNRLEQIAAGNCASFGEAKETPS